MSLTYTEAEVQKAVEKTLDPSIYVSYLPKGSDYITPELTPLTPTAILVPTTIKYVKDFTIKEINPGSGDFAVHFTGAAPTKFKVTMNTGVKTSINNVTINFAMRKNGVEETGISIPRKIGIGSDVGALGVNGVFELANDDYIQIYLESDQGGTITFIQTSISIVEVN